LLEALVDFARIDFTPERFKKVDLNLTLQAALQNLGAAVAESQAVITHEPLPSVRGEPSFLTQLFQNLIGNAIKYRHPSVAPQVRIFVRASSRCWSIGVQDNGIGFAQKNAEEIFQPFRRLHGRTEYPGSGLGLATCRRIVQKHGGEIRAEAVPGEGAIFIFTLPREKGDGTSAVAGAPVRILRSERGYSRS
jgi:signal transduction histidine kinase